jgi:hypothetical protein
MQEQGRRTQTRDERIRGCIAAAYRKLPKRRKHCKAAQWLGRTAMHNLADLHLRLLDGDPPPMRNVTPHLLTSYGNLFVPALVEPGDVITRLHLLKQTQAMLAQAMGLEPDQQQLVALCALDYPEETLLKHPLHLSAAACVLASMARRVQVKSLALFNAVVAREHMQLRVTPPDISVVCVKLHEAGWISLKVARHLKQIYSILRDLLGYLPDSDSSPYELSLAHFKQHMRPTSFVYTFR